MEYFIAITCLYCHILVPYGSLITELLHWNRICTSMHFLKCSSFLHYVLTNLNIADNTQYWQVVQVHNKHRPNKHNFWFFVAYPFSVSTSFLMCPLLEHGMWEWKRGTNSWCKHSKALQLRPISVLSALSQREWYIFAQGNSAETQGYGQGMLFVLLFLLFSVIEAYHSWHFALTKSFSIEAFNRMRSISGCIQQLPSILIFLCCSQTMNACCLLNTFLVWTQRCKNWWSASSLCTLFVLWRFMYQWWLWIGCFP